MVSADNEKNNEEIMEEDEVTDSLAEDVATDGANDVAAFSAVAPTSEDLEEKRWYILRVQSNKEDRVKTNLERRVLSVKDSVKQKFGRIVVPTELVSEIKKGFKRVVQRKLYPGYVMIEMVVNDETQYLVKSTPGVGDFVGPPTMPVPMSDDEVERMLHNCSQTKDKPKPKVSFKKGQNIKIKEGPFENFDGIVDDVNEQKGIVKVIVGIFGRYTQVELEFWQVESL